MIRFLCSIDEVSKGTRENGEKERLELHTWPHMTNATAMLARRFLLSLHPLFFSLQRCPLGFSLETRWVQLYGAPTSGSPQTLLAR